MLLMSLIRSWREQLAVLILPCLSLLLCCFPGVFGRIRAEGGGPFEFQSLGQVMDR